MDRKEAPIINLHCGYCNNDMEEGTPGFSYGLCNRCHAELEQELGHHD